MIKRAVSAAIAAVAIVALASPAAAQLVLTKDLAMGQNPNPAPGATVDFVITMRNAGAAPVNNWFLTDTFPSCFRPLTGCAQVMCSGGTSCGTCTLGGGGLGFGYSGLGMGPAGSATDTLTFRFQVVAGATSGMCTNTATTTDTLSSLDIQDTASVVIGAGLQLTKDLAAGQNPSPAPGDPVNFVITVRNLATTALPNWDLSDVLDPCLAPITSCAAQVMCAGGTSCGTCTPTATGFNLVGFGLGAGGTAQDTITLRVSTTAGLNPAMGCANEVRSQDPVTMDDISDSASVDIGGDSIELIKSLAPGQNPMPSIGDPVNFVITVRNLSAMALATWDLNDTLDACFAPITSCATQVMCSGGTSCGTCTPTAAGFNLNGYGLGAAGSAQDTITLQVSTNAGMTPAAGCTNTVGLQDPVSGMDLADTASVDIVNAGIRLMKDLAVGQNPNPAPGDPVNFVITMTNLGAALNNWTLLDVQDPCFDPVTCSNVMCSGGTSCGACTPTANGFSFAGLGMGAMGGPTATLTFNMSTRVAMGAMGVCNNTATAPDPVLGGDVSDAASVTIATPGAGITITKELAVGQNPNPMPGDPVEFVITVRNLDPTPLVNHSLSDVLDSCFEPLDCTSVACMGGTGCGMCSATANGFDQRGWGLGAAGQPTDTLTLQVTAVAGTTPGRCANTVSTANPLGGPDLMASASVDIADTMAECALNFDDSTYPPSTPMNWPRTAPWVYTAPCSGGDPILSQQLLTPAVEGDIGDPFVAPSNTLRQYQLTCGTTCPSKIAMTKDQVGGTVRLNFLP